MEDFNDWMLRLICQIWSYKMLEEQHLLHFSMQAYIFVSALPFSCQTHSFRLNIVLSFKLISFCFNLMPYTSLYLINFKLFPFLSRPFFILLWCRGKGGEKVERAPKRQLCSYGGCSKFLYLQTAILRESETL